MFNVNKSSLFILLPFLAWVISVYLGLLHANEIMSQIPKTNYAQACVDAGKNTVGSDNVRYESHMTGFGMGASIISDCYSITGSGSIQVLDEYRKQVAIAQKATEMKQSEYLKDKRFWLFNPFRRMTYEEFLGE